MEIIELKNVISDSKKLIDIFNSRLDRAEKSSKNLKMG